MNTFPRCWTPHTKAAELVKLLKEQIKKRTWTLCLTMRQDNSTTFSLYMTSGVQVPVARHHPWSPCILTEYASNLMGQSSFYVDFLVYYWFNIRLKIQVIWLSFSVSCCHIWTKTLIRILGLQTDDVLLKFQSLLLSLSKNSPSHPMTVFDTFLEPDFSRLTGTDIVLLH